MYFPPRLPFFVLSLLLIYGNALQAQTTATIEPVDCSQRGGLFDTPVSVGLSCTTPDAEIRYTLDGSEPD
ncbi:MAG TPA: chitobiase/beta-hexosaminidase C-terminal domain-containing protein, partial [Saprospiraceae bacterium]|nr:chitobiase/beta-hexosaminidase C-terminal domain-containing protein [Saprospiraceae bacterium]